MSYRGHRNSKAAVAYHGRPLDYRWGQLSDLHVGLNQLESTTVIRQSLLPG